MVTSYKAHNQAVNGISMDSQGTVIARYPRIDHVILCRVYDLPSLLLLPRHVNSCSDNGTVVIRDLSSEDEKDVTTIQRKEPVKAICVENENSGKKERSFLLGKSLLVQALHTTSIRKHKMTKTFTSAPNRHGIRPTGPSAYQVVHSKV
jgi:hypothetical protein